jgi:hypothetical protein
VRLPLLIIVHLADLKFAHNKKDNTFLRGQGHFCYTIRTLSIDGKTLLVKLLTISKDASIP